MHKKFLTMAIVCSLLLVGGGCFNQAEQSVPADQPQAGSISEEPIPTDVDSAVDDIINTIDSEIESADESGDASILGDETDGLSDFYESEYETE